MNLYTLLQRYYTFHKRLLLKVVPCSYDNVIEELCNISPSVNIPRSTRFHEKGIGIVIGNGVSLGENVTIYNNVTLGHRHGKHSGTPTIKDNVVLFCHCAVLGDVVVGENCIVGAYSLVINDIPPNCMVVGIPAKIVKEDVTK